MTTWNNADVQDASELVMNFDTGSYEADKFEVLPDGDYPLVLNKIEIKPTKDGTGKRANASWKVSEGEYKGRVIFDGINIVNKSEAAQGIGRKQLAGLLDALGKKGERNLASIIGLECVGVVRTEAARDGYEAKNTIKRYKPSGTSVIAPPSSAPAEKKSPPGFMAKKDAGGPPQLAK